MSPLEQMKADAAQCNRRMVKATLTGQKPNYGMGKGKTAAVARRHSDVRALMGRNMSHAEMAARLGVKVSTIKSDMAIIRAEDAHVQD